MDKELLAMLVCPLCKGKLKYRRETEELHCLFDGLAYPVRDGIPVMLPERRASSPPTRSSTIRPDARGRRDGRARLHRRDPGTLRLLAAARQAAGRDRRPPHGR